MNKQKNNTKNDKDSNNEQNGPLSYLEGLVAYAIMQNIKDTK
jgi:hypothetical protein